MKIIISILAIVLIILAIGQIVLSLFRRHESGKPKVPKPAWLCLAVGLLLTVSQSFWTIVPTGFTGVKVTMGQISDRPISPGFTFQMPFVEEIKTVDNRIQEKKAYEENALWCEASDQTEVSVGNVTIRYQIASEKSPWILANVKGDVVTQDVISSALKDATTKFDSLNCTKRDKIEPEATKNLQTALNNIYGEGTVLVRSLKVGNMDFTPEYNDAVTAKNVAKQEYEAEQQRNRTNIEKAEAQAEIERKNAQGKADAKLVEAKAEADAKAITAKAEAEANKLINNSLSDGVLKNKLYEKWDGKLPKATGGAVGVFDIANETTTETTAAANP